MSETGQDWRHDARCRDEDPELFFPVGETGPARQQTAEAKAVCRRCPVAADCLAWALKTGQDAGVWGGLSENERRALRRGRRSDLTPSSQTVRHARREQEILARLREGQPFRRIEAEMGTTIRTIRRIDRTLHRDEQNAEPATA